MMADAAHDPSTAPAEAIRARLAHG